jgi:anaerobic ribonucleoside-triphosphate reductase activating protein
MRQEILINLVVYPLQVLGPGSRVGVWTQGCSLKCQGCMSPHTWSFDDDKKRDIKELVKELKRYGSDAITISGGEPFEQENFVLFLQELKQNDFKDVLVYSGLSEEKIRKQFDIHLNYIDALICEPFMEGLETEFLYKGSDNQKLLILNKTLEEYYKNFKQKKKDKKLQRFGNTIVGIPYQSDIRNLYAV